MNKLFYFPLAILIALFALSTSCKNTKETQSKETTSISIDNSKISAEVRDVLKEVEGKEVSSELATQVGLTEKDGNYYLGGLAKMKEGSDTESLSSMGVLISTQAGNIWSVSIPIDKLKEVISLDELLYLDSKKAQMKED